MKSTETIQYLENGTKLQNYANVKNNQKSFKIPQRFINFSSNLNDNF